MRVEVKRDGRGVWYARPYLGKLPSGRVAKPYKSFPGAETREQAQAMPYLRASHRLFASARKPRVVRVR